MAFSLSSERPDVTAASLGPLRALFAWIAAARARQAKRVALTHLLELDPVLLDDIGVERRDVVAAMAHPRTAGRMLATLRSRRADEWLAGN